jgi:hypothetical protein
MSAFEFLQVRTHELEPDPVLDEAINKDSPDVEPDPEPSDTLLINAAKGSCPNPLPPWRHSPSPILELETFC